MIETMENFKGITEKWMVDEATVYCDDYFQSHICVMSDAFTKEFRMANALLISKAPEMLEMLEDILEQIEDGRTYITKEEIKKLIKEATTL